MVKKKSTKKSKSKMTKKTIGKKTPAKKVVKTNQRPIGKVNEPMTKSQMLTTISDHTGLPKKDVNAVFDVLPKVIGAHITKGGAGMFNLLGLMKLTVIHKPATKARKGINPFTGEEVMFKAKPARNVVKVRALKKLKDML